MTNAPPPQPLRFGNDPSSLFVEKRDRERKRMNIFTLNMTFAIDFELQRQNITKNIALSDVLVKERSERKH
jgi:hypothetical protein